MERATKGFENPYAAFVWRELSIIRQLERNGNYYQALRFAASLLKYLQPEVRKKQEQQVKAILAKVNKTIGNTRAADFFTTAQFRNRVARQLGEEYLEEVITELSNQLGARAYMEKGASASPRRPSKDRMRVPDYEVE